MDGDGLKAICVGLHGRQLIKIFLTCYMRKVQNVAIINLGRSTLQGIFPLHSIDDFCRGQISPL